MGISFYDILAKTNLSEKDREYLREMYIRLKDEIDLLREVFNEISLKNKSILDIGTGQGFACKFLVDNSENSLIITIDIDPLCLNRLRNVVGEKIERIIFIRGDASNMPFITSDFFDIAISHYTLSQISSNKIPAVLQEIRRVLKPNGLFIIVEGHGEGILDEARMLTLQLEKIYEEIFGQSETSFDTIINAIRKIPGLEIISMRKLNDGRLDPTVKDFAYFLLSNVKDEKLRKQISKIIKRGQKIGFREAPDYVAYVRKSP